MHLLLDRTINIHKWSCWQQKLQNQCPLKENISKNLWTRWRIYICQPPAYTSLPCHQGNWTITVSSGFVLIVSFHFILNRVFHKHTKLANIVFPLFCSFFFVWSHLMLVNVKLEIKEHMKTTLQFIGLIVFNDRAETKWHPSIAKSSRKTLLKTKSYFNRLV